MIFWELLNEVYITNIYDFIITLKGEVFSHKHNIDESLFQKVFNQYHNYIISPVKDKTSCMYNVDFNEQINKGTFLVIELSHFIHAYCFDLDVRNASNLIAQIESVKSNLHQYISEYKKTPNFSGPSYTIVAFLDNK